MKKFYPNPLLMLLLLFTVSTVGLAQVADPSRAAVTSLMCVGKWHISSLKNGEVTKQLSADEKAESWIQFRGDGTFTAHEKNNPYTGTWTYDAASQSFTSNDPYGTESHQIIKLTPTELIVSVSFQGAPAEMKMVIE